jgi:hypothetical protein
MQNRLTRKQLLAILRGHLEDPANCVILAGRPGHRANVKKLIKAIEKKQTNTAEVFARLIMEGTPGVVEDIFSRLRDHYWART